MKLTDIGNLGQASNPFGQITAPTSVTGIDAEKLPGLLIDMAFKGLIAGAMIYSVFNIIFAGYDFISAGDDPKKVTAAWGKIYQTVLGLAIAVGAFVIAAIFGRILFGDAYNILQPKLPTLTP